MRARSNTPNAKRDLPGLVGELVEPLTASAKRRPVRSSTTGAVALTDERADHAIMTMFRTGIVNVQRIADVLGQWEKPAHDWGEKTGWRLFNAATYTLAGRIAENPQIELDPGNETVG